MHSTGTEAAVKLSVADGTWNGNYIVILKAKSK